MVLESTMICVDNSEYMRNGDYVPTRLQAQQDAVNTVCRFKLRANPENNVGLLTLANSTEVLATLTTDMGKILTSLHKVQPEGFINLLTGIRIAHLALKHRQSKNHKMRIVVFVGSPLGVDEKEVTKLAKRLKKENVNIDIVNFGETDVNQTVLENLVSTINGREGTGSHLVTVPPSPHLAGALLSSPIIQGEDGSTAASFATGGGFEFGVDPNEDPELALALRVSMEEQRQRQQEEERRVTPAITESTGDAKTTAASTPTIDTATTTTTTTTATASTTTTATAATATPTATSPITTTASSTPVAAADGAAGLTEEEMLQQALAMSLESGSAPPPGSALAGGTVVVPSPALTAAVTAAATAAAAAAPPSSGSSAASVPDFSTMTEEEQIAYAMQISMQECQPKDEPMDIDQKGTVGEKKKKETPAEKKPKLEEEQDFSEVMSDPAFIQGVLQSLPGVDPQSEVVQQAVESLTAQDKDKDKDGNKKDKDIKMEEDKE